MLFANIVDDAGYSSQVWVHTVKEKRKWSCWIFYSEEKFQILKRESS